MLEGRGRRFWQEKKTEERNSILHGLNLQIHARLPGLYYFLESYGWMLGIPPSSSQAQGRGCETIGIERKAEKKKKKKQNLFSLKSEHPRNTAVVAAATS